ncbi:hypothetical protein BGX29_011433 [Mortierella sp. GBA35]|nr:hypothetical protein BGX29_011433 [Mortierella sp. GBA35]
MASEERPASGGGHDASLVSSGSSWGSPAAPSTAVLGQSTSASPSTLTAAGTAHSETTVLRGESSQSGTSPGSSFHQPLPRSWADAAKTFAPLTKYPTTAEAATKLQDQQRMTQFASITTSGEPMVKTVSAHSRRKSWDEDEEEDLSFLDEPLVFDDGSVFVVESMAQTIESSKDAEAETSVANPQPASSTQSTTSHQPHTEKQQTTTVQPDERIGDCGDVDLKRSLSNQIQSTSGQSFYQLNQEHGTRYGSHDHNHQSLWQGGFNDHRPSADRTQEYVPDQRRE